MVPQWSVNDGVHFSSGWFKSSCRDVDGDASHVHGTPARGDGVRSLKSVGIDVHVTRQGVSGVGWLPKLWKVPSRLYQRRFLQVKASFFAELFQDLQD